MALREVGGGAVRSRLLLSGRRRAVCASGAVARALSRPAERDTAIVHQCDAQAGHRTLNAIGPLLGPAARRKNFRQLEGCMPSGSGRLLIGITLERAAGPCNRDDSNGSCFLAARLGFRVRVICRKSQENIEEEDGCPCSIGPGVAVCSAAESK